MDGRWSYIHAVDCVRRKYEHRLSTHDEKPWRRRYDSDNRNCFAVKSLLYSTYFPYESTDRIARHKPKQLSSKRCSNCAPLTYNHCNQTQTAGLSDQYTWVAAAAALVIGQTYPASNRSANFRTLSGGSGRGSRLRDVSSVASIQDSMVCRVGAFPCPPLRYLGV